MKFSMESCFEKWMNVMKIYEKNVNHVIYEFLETLSPCLSVSLAFLSTMMLCKQDSIKPKLKVFRLKN